MKKLYEKVFQAVTEIDLDGATDEDILRISIAAEQSAVNLYNKLSRIAKNSTLVKVLKDVALEEKVHVGEFQAMLMKIDPEEEDAIRDGFEEVGEIMESKQKKTKKVFKVKEEVTLGEVVLEVGDEFIYLDDDDMEEDFDYDYDYEYYEEDEYEEDQWDYDRPEDYFSNMNR